MKKIVVWGMIGLVNLAVWIGVQLPDEKLHIVFCDVGQGDAELIVKGEVQILIDGGLSGSKVLDCLARNMPFWDRRLELVVNTHPDKDHVGGLDDVLERYQVSKLLAHDVEASGKDYKRMMELAGERGVEVVSPIGTKLLKVSGIELEILWPDESWITDLENMNGGSIVLMVKYGQLRALFTGDIGHKEELALWARGVLTKIDVLKVPHHGSKYSSSSEFVKALRPELAVFEVGATNSYGHPTRDALIQYDMVGAKIKRTDIDGEVEIASDGNEWWIKK